MSYRPLLTIPLMFTLGCNLLLPAKAPRRNITVEKTDDVAIYTVVPVGTQKGVHEGRGKFYDFLKDGRIDVVCRPADPTDKDYRKCTFIRRGGTWQYNWPGHRPTEPNSQEAVKMQEDFDSVLAEVGKLPKKE